MAYARSKILTQPLSVNMFSRAIYLESLNGRTSSGKLPEVADKE
jgi:hypothetical protein